MLVPLPLEITSAKRHRIHVVEAMPCTGLRQRARSEVARLVASPMAVFEFYSKETPLRYGAQTIVTKARAVLLALYQLAV